MPVPEYRLLPFNVQVEYGHSELEISRYVGVRSLENLLGSSGKASSMSNLSWGIQNFLSPQVWTVAIAFERHNERPFIC